VRRRIASMRAAISAKVSVPFLSVAEGLPGEPRGHALVAREEAEAGDGLVGRAETEAERRARRDRFEAVRRGLPEVDLVRRLGAVQEVAEPAEVGVGDEGGFRGGCAIAPMTDATSTDQTLVTGAGTSAPEQVTRTRTIDDLVEEAGLRRTHTRLLGYDLAERARRDRELHQQMVNRQLDAKALRLAKGGMSRLLNELADCGFAWRDIASVARVSVPAVRRWRQGEAPTGEHLLDVARIVALVETLRHDHLVMDVASWMEMPLAQGAPQTAIDLAAAGRLADVVDVAAGHATGETALDLWQPGWRQACQSDFEVFEAPDGQPGLRPAAADGP